MNPKILVADDDFDNRTIAAEALVAGGYDVIQAVNGQEAMDLALKELPSLVLLDLSMPKLDGWRVAFELKKDVRTRVIPNIAFTAHAMKGDEQKARESGCDDFLAKPCTPKKILEKLKAN